MKILVLGGTKFVGRHLVKLAVIAGHDVTTFNRGLSNSGLDQNTDVRCLIGDRSSDLSALRRGNWDVVYDLSGYLPGDVQASVQLLSERLGRYVFVSSISVYADGTAGGIDEQAPVHRDGDGYGPLKALCERKVLDLLQPGRGLIVRPGLIVGPFDPTHRFNYWIERVARGGSILAPGRPERDIQVIDARDLAAFMLLLGAPEGKPAGGNNGLELPGEPLVYNVAGSAGLTMGALLQAIERTVVEVRRHGLGQVEVPAVAPRFFWVSDDELLQRSVIEWTELPLWIAEKGDSASFYTINSGRAIEKGLTYRPIADTIQAICLQHPQLLKPGFSLAALKGTGDPRLLPIISSSLEEAILHDLGDPG